MGFAYSQSLSRETPTLPSGAQQLQWEKERSLHAAFRQVLLFALSALLLLLSGCCASQGARQLSALTTVLAHCLK